MRGRAYNERQQTSFARTLRWRTTHPTTRTQKTQAWLAGEVVLRGERLGLTDLPAALWRKAACRHLSLAGNRLHWLPPDVARLRALRRLLLGGNALAALPGEVGALRKLEHLEVQNNCLDDLPVALATCV